MKIIVLAFVCLYLLQQDAIGDSSGSLESSNSNSSEISAQDNSNSKEEGGANSNNGINDTLSSGESVGSLESLESSNSSETSSEENTNSKIKGEPRDCTDIKKAGNTKNGVYKITVGDSKTSQKTIDVFCDLSTGDEGWLVFQRRSDGSEDFIRGWVDYAKGFGAPTGEHWLGNDFLHAITSSARYKLRVDLTDFKGNRHFAEYSTFWIGSASDKYRLEVNGYSGNAGDSMTYHNGMEFSTLDADNDIKTTNCALESLGAWWYNACYQSNLNGLYRDGHICIEKDYRPTAVKWITLNGFCPMKTVEMKIARLD